MLTLSSVVFHLIQRSNNKEKRVKDAEINHPFEDPQYQTKQFPKSAQFLDFQWTPSGLSGQFKGVLSGLKVLDWQNLIQIDEKQFNYELMLKKALMRPDGPYIEKVTAGLDRRLDAQQELLQLVLDNLRAFHTNSFHFTDGGFTILPNNSTYRYNFLKWMLQANCS
jgi:hypothetical protein